MGNYKRTIISEDGSKMEITDPSLTENITVYTIQDESEKRGFYLLNESDKVIADDFLIALKLAYISYDDTLNDTSKAEIYNETIEQVNELTEDANTRKYLKKRIDVLFQTTITLDDIKKDLDNYSTDTVIIIIKEYIAETIDDKKEKNTEIKKWLVEYLAKRKAEEQPTEMLENEEFEDERSFTEKHPALTGVGKFLKKITLNSISFVCEIVGDEMLNTLSNAEKIVANKDEYDDATVKKANKFIDLYQETNDAGYTANDVLDEVKNYVDDIRMNIED